MLLLQLPFTFTAWKFWYCELDYKMIDLINTVQSVITNCLIELDFSQCSIVDDKKCHFLMNTQCFQCLTKFNVSGFKAIEKFIQETTSVLLHNTQLEDLDISNLNLDVEDCRALTQ